MPQNTLRTGDTTISQSTRIELLSASALREAITSTRSEGESFTASVERVARELQITPRILYKYLSEGVSVSVSESARKVVKHAVQQGAAPRPPIGGG